jgi:hypothetical protein
VPPSPRPVRALAAALALAGTALAGCTTAPSATLDTVPSATAASNLPSPSTSPNPTVSPTVSPTPSPTPTPTPTYRSPLDGEPAPQAKPVLVVKLDNTRYALPHAGLTHADVVYMEEVEYGITRLAAVFSTSIPRRIGPVRSARITDIDLLAQYGRPAFGYSGAQHRMFPVLDAASIYDVSPRTGAAGYSRDYHRRAPYNYYLDGHVALQRAPKATLARDMGFVFDEQVPDGGLVARRARMAWGYASAQFDYSRRRGTYAVTLNGQRATAEESADGQQAATVVIQYVRQTPSAFFDKGGGNTPHADTVGTGKAIVMRDGLAWDTTWSRPSVKDGTTFTRADGRVMTFKPGQLWVVLLDRKRKATVTPLTEPRPSPTATSSGAPTSATASASPAGQ